MRSASCEHLPLLTAGKGWPGVARAPLWPPTQGSVRLNSVNWLSFIPKERRHVVFRHKHVQFVYLIPNS